MTVPAEATIGRVIAELAGELDRVFARRDALAAEIEEVFLAHPFGELLSSLPGIGPRTGSRILAEIGDGTRFADGDRLASYAGLAPVTRQSGKSINGESKSRRGNHRLKNAMFLAAFASLRDPGVQSLLRPQTGRRQTPQRRPHLPRPPPLQRHPGHAPHPPALSARPSCTGPGGGGLTGPCLLPPGGPEPNASTRSA